MKQLSFLEEPKKEHGGSLVKGKRKSARTISTQQPIHLVLKSNNSVNLIEINKRNEMLIYLDDYEYK